MIWQWWCHRHHLTPHCQITNKRIYWKSYWYEFSIFKYQIFDPKQGFWNFEFLDPRHHLLAVLTPSSLFGQVATDTTSYIIYFQPYFSKKLKIQCGTEYLVFSTVSKWRVVVGAKWMAPMSCPARVWTLGTRWTTLTQNGWVLWFTWYCVYTSFKNTIC